MTGGSSYIDGKLEGSESSPLKRFPIADDVVCMTSCDAFMGVSLLLLICFFILL